MLYVLSGPPPLRRTRRGFLGDVPPAMQTLYNKVQADAGSIPVTQLDLTTIPLDNPFPNTAYGLPLPPAGANAPGSGVTFTSTPLLPAGTGASSSWWNSINSSLGVSNSTLVMGGGAIALLVALMGGRKR